MKQDFEYFNYRLERLKSKRTNYEPKWDELAVFCDARNAYFRVKKTNGDLSQLIPKTDDTAQLYLPLYAAIMNSMLSPQAYIWHQLKFFDQQVQDQYGDWLAQENEMLFRLRYSGASNFMSAINEVYISTVVYGHAILEMKKDRQKKRVSYTCLPVREFYIDKDFAGRINTFYRVVETTYKNLRDLFPSYIPAKFKSRKDFKWLDDKVELLHAVEPSLKKEGEFVSVYIDTADRHIIEENVIDHCPYLCVRSSVFPSSDDPYGLSPCMSILPSIKALNSLQFNFIKQTDMAGQPTLLTNSDIVDASKVAASGTVVEGGLDDEGRPMVQALRTYADYPALDYQIKMLQEKVKQALFINFFSSFAETQSRSATDAMLKANEKANLIAPAGDRIARELLIPMIELELKLYGDMNMLPPAPEGLTNPTLFTEFDITLDNPLLKGQRMDSANNIMTLLTYVGQVAAFDQSVVATINTDKTIRTLQDVMNIPSDIVNSTEETQAIIAEQERVAAQQAAIAAAPQIASTMKDGAAAYAAMASTNG